MAFKRPFHAQSRTPVRSSDLRRFRDSLSRQFPLLDPHALKLLTKDLLVAKAHTHLDEPCTVYYAPNGDPRFFKLQQQDDDDDEVVPTCYAFDAVAATTHENWIPTLGTAPAVVQNLISGSALFAAGVSPRDLANLVNAAAASSSSPSSLSPRKGSLVGITVASSDSNPRRIVAIGRLAAEPAEIQRSQREDKGGKAVLTLHARGDFLWQAGSKLEPQVESERLGGAQSRRDKEEEETGDAQVAEATDRLAATDLSRSNSAASSSSTTEAASSSLSARATASSPKSAKKGKGKKADASPAADNQDATSASTESSAAAATPASTNEKLTPSEADSVLLNALLLALSTSAALQKPSTFPLPASSLYSTYILPFRPASPPSHATVDLKKSSFKKLDRFVKQVVKKGWIAAKELKKGSGDWIVTSVELRHPDIERAPRYKAVAELGGAAGSDNADATTAATTTARGSDPNAAASGAATAGSGSGASGLEVRELWKLSGDSVKELFRSVPHDRPPHDLYTTSELSSLLRKFTDSHSLSHPSQRSLLLLHPSASPRSPSLEQLNAIELLARCVCKKGENPAEVGKERGAPGLVSRDEALKRIKKDGCTGYWGMRRGGGGAGAEDEVVKKGSPPTIKVAIKNVGKRQVTLISGHEPWDLFTSEEFAEKLKHASASSTSVQPLAGSAKKGQTPKVEIMCQGTHDALVSKLLVGFGVPKAYIEVDLSKSKK